MSNLTRCLIVFLFICLGCMKLQAQDDQGIYGTWKIDIQAFSDAATEAGQSGELFKIRLHRMGQMRYIFNEKQMTVVTDDFPREMKWELIKQEKDLLEFKLSPRGEIVRLQRKDEDALELTTIAGGRENIAKLLKVSDIETWQAPKHFEIGMVAPEVKADRWLTDLNPPMKMGDGKVYVVDFWATWCGPCLAQMPKLAEIQSKFGNDRLCVLAISNEPWDAVELFLKREDSQDEEAGESRGDQLLKFSKTISIGIDHEGETFRSYMVAAGLRAIPTTFIVWKTGHLEWVGSGDELEDVIQQVIDDKWDRKAFASQFAGFQKAYTEFPKIQQLLAEGETEAAEKLIDQLYPIADSRLQQGLEGLKKRISAGR